MKKISIVFPLYNEEQRLGKLFNRLINFEKKKIDKLEIISVAEVFGESMKRIVEGTSLSSLFRGFN